MPATRKPRVSQAILTMLPAPALALLAHCLENCQRYTRCKEARGVNILLILGEKPQTLGCGIDDCLKSKGDDLDGSWYVTSNVI